MENIEKIYRCKYDFHFPRLILYQDSSEQGLFTDLFVKFGSKKYSS